MSTDRKQHWHSVLFPEIVDFPNQRGGIIVPSGFTAERPSPAVNGTLRYNESLQLLEGYINSQWQTIESSGGIGITTYLGLSDTPSSYVGQAGRIPRVNVTEDALEFTDRLTVATVNKVPSDTIVMGVNRINFDNAKGFDVIDNASGVVTIDFNSSFNPIQVAGQPTLTASGEEPLEIVAGTNITITTSAVASPKRIVINSTAGGGGATDRIQDGDNDTSVDTDTGGDNVVRFNTGPRPTAPAKNNTLTISSSDFTMVLPPANNGSDGGQVTLQAGASGTTGSNDGGSIFLYGGEAYGYGYGGTINLFAGNGFYYGGDVIVRAGNVSSTSGTRGRIIIGHSTSPDIDIHSQTGGFRVFNTNSAYGGIITFFEGTSYGSNSVALRAPANIGAGQGQQYTLPFRPTANGQILSSTIAGVMSWVTAGGGNELTDVDDDTRVRVEVSAGDNRVRFDTGTRPGFDAQTDILRLGSNEFRLDMGTTTGNAQGADVHLTAGVGTSQGGDVRLDGGYGPTFGGDITIGAGGGGSAGGSIGITGGYGNAGVGGSVGLTGGPSLSSSGGDATLSGGYGSTLGGRANVQGGTSTTQGGDVYIMPGPGPTEGTVQLRGSSSSTPGAIQFRDNDNSNYVRLEAPATVTTDVTWVLPDDDPSVVFGQFLTTDASGNMSFAVAGGSAGDRIQDSDNDTSIDVDNGADDDIIRISLGTRPGWTSPTTDAITIAQDGITAILPYSVTGGSQTGGSIHLESGKGRNNANGGDFTIRTGDSGGAGAGAKRGGDILLMGGQSSSPFVAPFRGGNVTLQAGIGGGTRDTGGTVNIYAGGNNGGLDNGDPVAGGGDINLTSGYGGDNSGTFAGSSGGPAGDITIAGGVGGDALTDGSGGRGGHVTIVPGAGGAGAGAGSTGPLGDLILGHASHIWPETDGSAGQALTTDGGGNLQFGGAPYDVSVPLVGGPLGTTTPLTVFLHEAVTAFDIPATGHRGHVVTGPTGSDAIFTVFVGGVSIGTFTFTTAGGNGFEPTPTLTATSVAVGDLVEVRMTQADSNDVMQNLSIVIKGTT